VRSLSFSNHFDFVLWNPVPLTFFLAPPHKEGHSLCAKDLSLGVPVALLPRTQEIFDFLMFWRTQKGGIWFMRPRSGFRMYECIFSILSSVISTNMTIETYLSSQIIEKNGKDSFHLERISLFCVSPEHHVVLPSLHRLGSRGRYCAHLFATTKIQGDHCGYLGPGSRDPVNAVMLLVSLIFR